MPKTNWTRDAAADPVRQGLSPAGLFRGKLEDGFGARRLVKQGPPIGDRILLRCRRQFVHEAFGHEHIVRRPDAAPERGRNAGRFDPQILDVHVRKGIGQIDRAIGGVGVEAVVERRREPSREDRGAGEAMVPGDRLSLLIETGRHPVEEIRPVHVVLDVFLARPHDLHGTIDLLRDLHGANDAIDLQPPAKAAADQMVVDHHLVQRQAGSLRCHRLSSRDDLIADPDFAAVLADMHRAVHRLHRRVREERNLVGRLELRDGARHRLVDVADVLRDRPCIERRLFKLVPRSLVGVEPGVRTVVPFDHQRRQTLSSQPPYDRPRPRRRRRAGRSGARP